MKFSENWLRSHVPTSASRDELSAVLTAIGLEVEEVTALGEGLQHVVVARIVEAYDLFANQRDGVLKIAIKP